MEVFQTKGQHALNSRREEGPCVAVSWRVRRGRGTGEREAKMWPWLDPEYTHLGAILRVQVLAHGYSEKGFVQGQERLMF